jgi:four helix bundle protein
MGSVRELLVWQKAFALCIATYDATEGFPSHERFGLAGELRKTARSVVCNIAEGHRRVSRKEFLRFLNIAHGSAAELHTQLLIATARSYIAKDSASRLLASIEEVNRMLSGLTASLKQPSSTKD